MNPRLVVCLIASVPVGLLTGLASLAAGWGVLVALLTYWTGGSLALVALTLALQTDDAPAPQSLALPSPELRSRTRRLAVNQG